MLDNIRAPNFEKYTTFVLDIWGVLHQSWVPYPDALESLNLLKDRGSRVALLSNSPARAGTVATMLGNIGISKGAQYDFLMTSGEAFALIFQKQHPDVKSVLLFGIDNNGADLTALGAKVIPITDYKASHYDAVVMTGVDWQAFIAKPGESPEEVLSVKSEPYLEVLQYLKSTKKEIYCLNPDWFVNAPNGQLVPCAGYFANQYEELSGTVHWIGKPHVSVIEALFSRGFNQDFQRNIDKPHTIMVGDGARTDLKLAENAGIDGCLCLSGLPKSELGQSPEATKIAQYIQDAGTKTDNACAIKCL